MAAGLALLLFGAVTALLSLQLPIGTLRGPGSGLFPLALGLILMGLAGWIEPLATPTVAWNACAR